MRDWVTALRMAILSFQGEFEWGSVDCCQFVRAYAFNLTGKDFGAELDYSNQIGANRIISEHDGLRGLFTSILGEPTSQAMPGDIVIVRVNESDQAAGVFNGGEVWTVHPDYGICRLPHNAVLWSWICL